MAAKLLTKLFHGYKAVEDAVLVYAYRMHTFVECEIKRKLPNVRVTKRSVHMNKNKIWLLLAMIAIVGFIVVSCGGEEDPELGTLKLNVSGEVPTGTTIIADYQGTEKVTFKWEKDGDVVLEGEGKDEFKADDEGSYTVTISFKGFTDKTSPVVKVSKRAHFFGTWVNSNFDTDKVVISATKLEFYEDDLLLYTMEDQDLNFSWGLFVSSGDYQQAATIKGKLTQKNATENYAPYKEGTTTMGSVGDTCIDYWYIHTDNSKLVRGLWNQESHPPRPVSGTGSGGYWAK
jgi:hypothetical protein